MNSYNHDPFYPDSYAREDNEGKESIYPADVDWASIGGDEKYHKDIEGYDIFGEEGE